MPGISGRHLLSTYPVTSGLGDIFTNLLWRETKGTDLGSESGLCSDLTTCGPQVAIACVSLKDSLPRTNQLTLT